MVDETTPSKLTHKQRAFINAYISNGFNGGQAAITAGYAPDSSYVEASRLLRNANIRDAIETYFEAHAMSAKEVVARLSDHARGDIGDIWDEDSGTVDWDKARSLGKTALIKKIKHKTTRITRGTGEGAEDVETFEDEIELHSPQFALNLLGKQHGLFVDKSEVKLSGEVTMKTYKTFSPDDWDNDAEPLATED